MKNTNGQTAMQQVVIVDTNDYVTSDKIIGELIIRHTRGERIMSVVRSGINKYRAQ